MQQEIDAFQARLGYRFRDAGILRKALCHGSYHNEHPEVPSNERMEFLGDSVLGFVVSDLLYRRYPDLPEGPLTARKALVVGRTNLAVVSRRLDLATYLLLGQGERKEPTSSMLADALEAVIAGVYLDGGVREVRAVVKRLFGEAISERDEDLPRDWKSELQQRVLSGSGSLPRYRSIGESGPDHDRVFVFEVVVPGGRTAVGRGPSKKAAQQGAARAMLVSMESGEGRR